MLAMIWDKTINPHSAQPVSVFLYVDLTDSQFRCRFLVHPAELWSIHVVAFEDADKFLQSFLAGLHILLRPISEQQPGVTGQLLSCQTQREGRTCFVIISFHLLQNILSDAHTQKDTLVTFSPFLEDKAEDILLYLRLDQLGPTFT